MTARYVVESVYLAQLGEVSQVRDTQGPRRILVAGAGHRTRAEKRAAELNAVRVVERRGCCPPGRRG